MSDPDNFNTEVFERRSKALFDTSVDGLSDAVRSRLTQVRHQALSRVSPDKSRLPRRLWISAVGLSAAAVLVIMVLPSFKADRALPATFAAADDMALLLNPDDLEMLEDMEFYAWLDSNPQVPSESPPAKDSDDAHS